MIIDGLGRTLPFEGCAINVSLTNKLAYYACDENQMRNNDIMYVEQRMMK
jgi:hypothetical protein